MLTIPKTTHRKAEALLSQPLFDTSIYTVELLPETNAPMPADELLELASGRCADCKEWAFAHLVANAESYSESEYAAVASAYCDRDKVLRAIPGGAS